MFILCSLLGARDSKYAQLEVKDKTIQKTHSTIVYSIKYNKQYSTILRRSKILIQYLLIH